MISGAIKKLLQKNAWPATIILGSPLGLPNFTPKTFEKEITFGSCQSH
jgi:hypothetical protein